MDKAWNKCCFYVSLEGFTLENVLTTQTRASEHMTVFLSTRVFSYQSEFLVSYKKHQSKQVG